ncbi:Membrane-associated zinc metalloprotease [Lachnospiraceae bacterium TWA4]|nr:Membrane-associated zinc metalloprotease [Lachnospiraceae bacterium TWA4]
MSIVLSFLVFSLLIISHELGHFLLAKFNGVEVIEFSVGMGPRILSHQGKETRYSLKLVPFGGSCMMAGEFDEDPDHPQEGSFIHKSVWARISIVAAGPLFNFLFALLLSFVVIASIGIDKPVVSEVTKGYPVAEAGIQKGDKITKINEKHIVTYKDISLYLTLHPQETMEVVYERDGVERAVVITPKYDEQTKSYRIGIINYGEREKQSPIGVIRYGFHEVKFWISYTFTSLKMLVGGQVSMNEVSGPVGLVSTMSAVVEDSKTSGIFYVFLNLSNFFILLSANLGVMNLLPFPALDGGRLFFLIIEALRGKPIDREKEAYIHMAGMVLLMAFMVFVLYNDVIKLW